MAIPTYQELMLPLLQFAADGAEHSIREAREGLGGGFKLTSNELSELLPSGTQPLWANRVAWAKTYLLHAGLLESTRRGYFRISLRGREVLANPPTEITPDFLKRFEEFRDFLTRSHQPEAFPPIAAQVAVDQDRTPEELLDQAYRRLREELAGELLERVKGSSPGFFERLVVELLVRMGYGGSRAEAGQALGRSGDEGIDGLINEDRLGLDTIFIQAKRWDGTVGRPEIQRFVGALHGKRARKGVFLTTGVFSSEAREYVSHIEPKLALLDGHQVGELMIDFGVGVTLSTTYEIKRVDSDYFGEG